MALDANVRTAVYRHFADTGAAPSARTVAERTGAPVDAVRDAYQALQRQRVLVLQEDGETIRMAPPFSGVRTQHRVTAGSVEYFANCAWDAFGIAAALQRDAVVHSRCEQSHEPLVCTVGRDGPAVRDWVFHCVVPAARWWENIVFT